MRKALLAGVVAGMGATVGLSSVEAALTVQINYSGNPIYAPDFQAAADIWENLLKGYQDGFVVARSSGSSYLNGQTVSTVFIDASVVAIDGVGGILGQAGPEDVALDSSGFLLATDGSMEFDSADVANLVTGGSWTNVILHEMAHVLGFGTLWTNNGVYVNGSGEFTGANATAAWQSEFGQPGTPDVELGGGAGTANGHWNEVNGGGGLTGIVDGLGRDMRNELMTGWLNSPAFISDMTVMSFRDIGFSVPEPTTLMAAAAIVPIVLRRRR
jgi:hypothetical protein